MYNKILVFIIIAILLFQTGCSPASNTRYKRYSESIFDTFDTLVQVIIYTESEEEFRYYMNFIHARLQELHRFYDIYNNYEGINNLKTINDHAGIKPVKVDQDIIDLILFSKEWSERTGGSVNIALGPVLKIWHAYRDEALFNPAVAELPPMELLREAAKYTDPDQIRVDQEKMTVYLADSRMSLDVGAVAKGFALEMVVAEAAAAGIESAIISIGGNIRTIGQPLDHDRDLWGIGVQDPDASIVGGSEKLLDIINLAEGSVDSSGDYQRFYIFNDKIIHHLIDPQTLMPAGYYRAVTVVADHAGVADFMSTALFLVPIGESLLLAESINNFEALWVMPDGEVRTTAGMKALLRSHN